MLPERADLIAAFFSLMSRCYKHCIGLALARLKLTLPIRSEIAFDELILLVLEVGCCQRAVAENQ